MGELLAVRAAEAFLLALLLAARAGATNLYVAVEYGTDTNTGLAWETAKSNLQSLILLSGQSNTYNVGAGTYLFTNEAPTLLNATRVIGTNRDAVVFFAAPATNCLRVAGVDVWVEAVTLTGGSNASSAATNWGGGVAAQPTTTITNCLIVSNYAFDGGGSVRATVRNSTLAFNVAYYRGGGMYGGTAYDSEVTDNSSLTYDGGGLIYGAAYRSAFRRNYAGLASLDSGGGAADSILDSCLFSSNVAGGSGGGVHASLASNCVFEYNVAKGGGGASYSRLFWCAFATNEATGTVANSPGGGAQNSTSRWCLYIGNVAARHGGALGGGEAYDCVLTENYVPGGRVQAAYNMTAMANCTVVGHTGRYAAVSGVSASAAIANNVIWNTYSNHVQTSTNVVNNWTNDPLFIPGSYKIASTSPCVDAGNNTYASSALDFYGRDRVVDGGTGTATVDIGAAEYQSGIDDPASAARKKMLLPLLFE